MKRAGYTIVGLLMVVLAPTARTMARVENRVAGRAGAELG
jgi:hypothetical protein